MNIKRDTFVIWLIYQKGTFLPLLESVSKIVIFTFNLVILWEKSFF